jgi:hypothetical protein
MCEVEPGSTDEVRRFVSEQRFARRIRQRHRAGVLDDDDHLSATLEDEGEPVSIEPIESEAQPWRDVHGFFHASAFPAVGLGQTDQLGSRASADEPSFDDGGDGSCQPGLDDTNTGRSPRNPPPDLDALRDVVPSCLRCRE